MTFLLEGRLALSLDAHFLGDAIECSWSIRVLHVIS
jgi:hypothetical protein